jgi:hypothetical protein
MLDVAATSCRDGWGLAAASLMNYLPSPGIQSGADDTDDIFQTDSWARSDKIRAIEGIQLTQ